MVASSCWALISVGCLASLCLSSNDCNSLWENEPAVGSGIASVAAFSRYHMLMPQGAHERPMRTYILPTTDWAVLLPIILRDAQPGDVLEVHTPTMWDLTTQMATDAGRTDLVIRLRDRTAAVVEEQS